MLPRRARALTLTLALIATGCADQASSSSPLPGSASASASSARPFAASTANRARLELALAQPAASNGDAPASEVGRFRVAASLNAARQGHTATTLPDGRVLVVGGFDRAGIHQDAELYDPITDTWTPSTELGPGAGDGLMMKGTVATARQHHSAMLLPGTSRVL